MYLFFVFAIMGVAVSLYLVLLNAFLANQF